jgi:hypothetical protein
MHTGCHRSPFLPALHTPCLIAGGAAAVAPFGRGLEESFVVLPGSASVLRPHQPGPSTSSRDLQHLPPSARLAAAAAAAAAAGTGSFPPEPGSGSGSAGGAGSRAQKAGFNAKLDHMSRLCELASTVTAVDHPLCLDCAAQLKDEVQKQLEELDTEIAAYSEAVKRLEAESPAAVPQVRSGGGWLAGQSPLGGSSWVLRRCFLVQKGWPWESDLSNHQIGFISDALRNGRNVL